MASENLNRILRFVRRAMSEGEKGRECRVIGLRHISGERERAENVDNWPVRNAGSSKVLIDPDDLSRAIHDRAQEDADAFGSAHVQRYAAVPYYGEGNTVPGARLILSYRGSDDEDDDEDGSFIGSPSEKATPKGIETARMRHLETYFRLSTGSTYDTHKILRAENTDLREQVRELNKELREERASRLRSIELTETLHSQATQRMLAAEHSRVKTEVIRAIGDKAINMVPTIAGYFLGNHGSPSSAPPVVEMVKSFFTTLRPEQYAAMMGILDESQAMAVKTAADFMIEEEQRQKASEAAKKLGPAGPSAKQLPSAAE